MATLALVQTSSPEEQELSVPVSPPPPKPTRFRILKRNEIQHPDHVEVQHKYGIIDRQGTIIAPENIAELGEFSEGLASFGEYMKKGYIDELGNVVITPQFWDVQPFSEGLAAVNKRGKWGFVNKAGKLVVPAQWDDAKPFHCGRALVRRENSTVWECIDRDSKFLNTGEWAIGDRFSENAAPAFSNGEWSFIDTVGKPLFSNKFARIRSFSEGQAAAALNDSGGASLRWGYINRKGKWVVEPVYREAGDFHEGLAAVAVDSVINGKTTSRWGFIDRKGNVTVPCRYNEVFPFSEGLARVAFFNYQKLDNKLFGFVGKDGVVVVSPQYTWANDFSEGYAAVAVEKSKELPPGYGRAIAFIDVTGKIKIPPRFACPNNNCDIDPCTGFLDYLGGDNKASLTFRGGLSEVRENRQQGYIDTTGQFVWSRTDLLDVLPSDQLANIVLKAFSEKVPSALGTCENLTVKKVDVAKICAASNPAFSQGRKAQLVVAVGIAGSNPGCTIMTFKDLAVEVVSRALWKGDGYYDIVTMPNTADTGEAYRWYHKSL
jgi:hypothetical protein